MIKFFGKDSQSFHKNVKNELIESKNQSQSHFYRRFKEDFIPYQYNSSKMEFQICQNKQKE